MKEYDEAVLRCFLEQQEKLFYRKVAENEEEARIFLEECMAVVADSPQEVRAYFEEEGVDVEDFSRVLEEDEVFAVGDGRYLIVEG